MINLLNAQITTNEQPYSWKSPDGLITGKEDVIMLPVPDKVRIENEDKINDQEPGPLRFAYPVHVNFTTENSGSWQTLNNSITIEGGTLLTGGVYYYSLYVGNSLVDTKKIILTK
jgi:hypothetical protein